MKSINNIIITCPETSTENVQCFTSKPNAHGTFWNLHVKINLIFLKLIDQFNWNFVLPPLYWCRADNRKCVQTFKEKLLITGTNWVQYTYFSLVSNSASNILKFGQWQILINILGIPLVSYVIILPTTAIVALHFIYR